jgi:hypothetical protein
MNFVIDSSIALKWVIPEISGQFPFIIALSSLP